jgi:hypothetical protein
MKQMIKASIMFITALSLFVTVVFAWFTLTNESNINQVNFDVVDGFSFEYEIKYFTKDYIYKYDPTTQSILVYDASISSWVSPVNLPSGSVYLIDGIFISQYDVLIPENNYKDNIIIEISIEFTNEIPMLITKRLIADQSIAEAVVPTFNLETSRPYYLSEVSNIQTLISNSYNHYDDTFNKYSMLNTEFNLLDVNNDFIYPMYSFYQNSIYQSTIELGDSLIQPNSTYKFYYNFTYDEILINQFFNQEFQNVTYSLSNIPMILFFQDIQMTIYGGNES